MSGREVMIQKTFSQVTIEKTVVERNQESLLFQATGHTYSSRTFLPARFGTLTPDRHVFLLYSFRQFSSC